jgi:oxalate decarboxylase/phosphoglucose isomerase-like protein (cupin superfamily)
MKRVARVEDIKEWFDCEKAVYYTGGDKRWLRDKIVWQRLIGPEDSKDLIFGIAKLDPGQIHLLHHHEGASELYYVLKGMGKFTVDEEVVDGSPGTGIYMPPGSKHRIENNGEQTLELFFAYNFPQYNTILDE